MWNVECSGNTEYGEQDMQLLESVQYSILHGWQINDWFVQYVDMHQDSFPISFRFVEKNCCACCAGNLFKEIKVIVYSQFLRIQTC